MSAGTMTSKERVRAALEHRPPDRPPVWEYFWPQWEDRWLVDKGFASWNDVAERGVGRHNWERPSLSDWGFPWERDIYDYYEIDMRLIGANTDPLLDGHVVIEETPTHQIVRDGWGVVCKQLRSAEQSNVPNQFLASPINNQEDLEHYHFDAPSDPIRFAAWSRELIRHPDVPFFVNLQGPLAIYYHLRGIENGLLDVIDRPAFVRRVAEQFTDFQIEIGTTQIKLAAAAGNPVLGVWLFEDIAYNTGLLLSPLHYQHVFRPPLERLMRAVRKAGAEFVIFHSDGDIRMALPMLVEIGIDAIQPMEVRAGMDVNQLKAQYGRRLAFVGNIDNTGTLAVGTQYDIYREVVSKLPAASRGGYIIGSSHSIGLDVSTSNYECFRELVREFPSSDRFRH
jgi:uroporphyrinogen-III decarboxylase